jgi:hypothetical protein
METLKDINEPFVNSSSKPSIGTSPKENAGSFEDQSDVIDQESLSTLQSTSNRARVKRRSARLIALGQKIGQRNRRPNSRTFVKESHRSLEIRSSLISQPPVVPRSVSDLHLIKTSFLLTKKADKLSVDRSRK